MNTRKEYPTFEELWNYFAQEESSISEKDKPKNKYDDQAFITRFKNFKNKRKFISRNKPNKEKDMLELKCFNCRQYGHYKNHCPELKKRKETHEASFSKKGNPQRRPSRIKQTSYSRTR
jgi:phage terminase small subunit